MRLACAVLAKTLRTFPRATTVHRRFRPPPRRRSQTIEGQELSSGGVDVSESGARLKLLIL